MKMDLQRGLYKLDEICEKVEQMLQVGPKSDSYRISQCCKKENDSKFMTKVAPVLSNYVKFISCAENTVWI